MDTNVKVIWLQKVVDTMMVMLHKLFSRHKPETGALDSTFPFFSSGDPTLGGLFHCLVGPAQLEDSASGWQDRFRLTSILLLAGTALSNGALDTVSTTGGVGDAIRGNEAG